MNDLYEKLLIIITTLSVFYIFSILKHFTNCQKWNRRIYKWTV